MGTREQREHILKVLPEIQDIGDEAIREGVIGVYEEAMRLAGVDDLGSIPFTRTYRTEVPYPVHVRAVTGMAREMARDLAATGIGIDIGIDIDMDVLTAGALLHDVGKVMEYGDGELSGPLVKHTYSGAALAQEAGLPSGILHCIIYHSYEGEGRRRSVESVVIHRCDRIHFEACGGKG